MRRQLFEEPQVLALPNFWKLYFGSAVTVTAAKLTHDILDCTPGRLRAADCNDDAPASLFWMEDKGARLIEIDVHVVYR
jgi:hypothetical protein